MKAGSIVSLILLLAAAFSANGTTILVTSSFDSGPGTLRAAIAAAASGDTIALDAGISNTTITLASTLDIPVGKQLVITKGTSAGIKISGNNLVRIFRLQSNFVQPNTVTLSGLNLINAYTTGYGGGILAEHQGVIIAVGCKFEQCIADTAGSAIFGAYEGAVQLQADTFINNQSFAANDEGGSAVFVFGPNRSSIQNCYFAGNRGINGAALHGLNASLTIDNCIFWNNKTTDATYISSQPNAFLRGFGGALYVDRATQGPPSTATGAIIIDRCKFIANQGMGSSGGAYIYTDETDSVIITRSMFDSNKVFALPGNGGGGAGALEQMNDSKNLGFWIQDCSFTNNEAEAAFGGIRVRYADTRIENTTFYNNKGLLSGDPSINPEIYANNGGALNLFDMTNSVAVIKGCTFASNYAGWVGGALASDNRSSTYLKNTIFADNVAGNPSGIYHHVTNVMADSGNNLQATFSTVDITQTAITANPLLQFPAYNGSPYTLTMALSNGSPAINAGADCMLTDQRGVARVGVCDLGAYEFGASVPLPLGLNEFIASKVTEGIMLRWSIANSGNACDVQLERSDYDVQSFRKIYSISIPQNGGNNYNYLDQDVMNVYKQSGNAYYRLRLVSDQSKVTYSNIRPVSFSNASAANVLVWPNPFSNAFNIKLTSGLDKSSWVLRDVFGKITKEGKILSITHPSVFTVDANVLLPGIYYLSIIQGARKDVFVLGKR
jgi:hypothetical protein